MSTYIVTVGGQRVDLVAPHLNSIRVRDIAFALSHINRYTGHVGTYSVAEHSLHVARLVEPEFQLEALLHDAAEAYIGDVSSPLKSLLPDYRIIEARFDDVIGTRFRLNGTARCTDTVKHADTIMLRREVGYFWGPTCTDWEPMGESPLRICDLFESAVKEALSFRELS